MVYSVGKAIREVRKKIDSIYLLSGDDYFLQNFFIKNVNKAYDIQSKPRYFNFEEENDTKVFFEEISLISLFAHKDIFVIRNISRISKSNKDEILKYLSEPREDLITIFISDDFYSKINFFTQYQ